jgi:hypothetical protein
LEDAVEHGEDDVLVGFGEAAEALELALENALGGAAAATARQSTNGARRPASYRTGRPSMSANVSALAALITVYFAAAEAESYAASTLAGRRLHLSQFLEWCDARGLLVPDELTPGVLERYRQWLYHVRQSDGAALSWATQSHKLTALRMLLAWAARSKRITVNPAADPRCRSSRGASRAPCSR